MFSVPRVVKRGAVVGAVVALVVAAAALSPRRAEAQLPFGCFAQPVTIVQPVASLTGFVVWQPVVILQTVCPNQFIGSPFHTGFGVVSSAFSGFNPSFFHSCPSSLGCFFGPGQVRSVFFQTTSHVSPCHSCRPHRVDPCHSCRPRPISPCHSCRPKH
jgi:hypothetical protein